MIGKKSRHSAFRTRVLLDTGTELFKTNENWAAPGKFGTKGVPNQVALRQVFKTNENWAASSKVGTKGVPNQVALG